MTLRTTAMRAFAGLRDPRVPTRLKIMAIGACLFIISPLNLLGDIPILGIFDDAALLGFVLTWFNRASLPFLNAVETGLPVRR